MPRYSVIVEITRDVVVKARSENDARKKVKAILDAVQQREGFLYTEAGRKYLELRSRSTTADPLYSMDAPEIGGVSEMVDEYVSGTGDDYLARP